MPVLKATVRWHHDAFEFFEVALATKFPYSSYKQVFVDESYQEFASYATLSIMRHVKFIALFMNLLYIFF